MNKKAMILGAGGQDGHYLSKILQDEGVVVMPVTRQSNVHLPSLIQTWEPDFIFHLAATSSTKHHAVLNNHDVIGTGCIQILEEVLVSEMPTKIFFAGSALQFINSGKPIKETDPLDCSSHYACVRNYALQVSRYYRSKGVKVYNGFFFNHESLLRKEDHVSQTIAIAAKNGYKINIGKLSVEKEWMFAGDAMDAVWKLVNQDQVFEANIGSGMPYSIQHWAELCFSKRGRDWKEYVTERKDFTPQWNVLFSDPSVIMSLGWKPKVGIEELASMMTS